MNKSLNILFIPISGFGHINSCIGQAQVLIERGHHVTFLLNDQWKGKLIKYGIEEVIIKENANLDDIKKDSDGSFLYEYGQLGDKSPLEKVIMWNYDYIYEKFVDYDENVANILPIIKPDLIILDKPSGYPSIEVSGIPWVWAYSAGPLIILQNGELPPPFSGLSVDGNKDEWVKFKIIQDKALEKIWTRINNYNVSKGAKPLKKYEITNPSEYLNIYCFPLELDYLDINTLPNKYLRFDNFMRKEEKREFEFPIDFISKPGKLIYFSFGSLGFIDLNLMKRLITFLGNSSHRYIVSKGPLHSQYELPPNMWGQQTVPQIQVLPIVDLVITHGGNNTVNESFAFGKPLIVLPLCGDQYDNAQQIEDKGFGLRLDPYLCTEDQLLSSIEKLLNDKELNEKLHKISKRIQTENSLEKLPEIIENLVKK